jgi:hypothetical protein
MAANLRTIIPVKFSGLWLWPMEYRIKSALVLMKNLMQDKTIFLKCG